jgi:hypothetical protein
MSLTDEEKKAKKRAYLKEWRKKNRDKIAAYRRAWGEKNRDKEAAQQKAWREANPEKEAARQKAWRRIPENLLSKRIYRRIWDFGIRPPYPPMEELVGCSIKELVDHIESQFAPGMTWDAADWHLDHIRPMSSFSDEEKVTKAHHYANLQPLWPEDNRAKGEAYAAWME